MLEFLLMLIGLAFGTNNANLATTNNDGQPVIENPQPTNPDPGNTGGDDTGGQSQPIPPKK